MMEQHKYQNGLALIVIVSILATLGMLAFALAFRSRIAIKEANLLIERIRQDQIAHAACEKARSVLMADDESIDCLDEEWSGWHELMLAQTDDHLNNNNDLWQVDWKLTDESSKINVNLAYPDMLLGLECLDEAAVASILDWVDQDDVPSPDGAENDYYTGLAQPYRCKNAPVDNIEELILIKGISPQIYYGSHLNESITPSTETSAGLVRTIGEDSLNDSAGLCDLLTVYGNGRININTASKEIFDAIPLLSDAAVNEIISVQKSIGRKFSSMDDIENNDNFTTTDKLSLLNVTKFNSDHFQLQIKIRRKENPFWCEYAAIVERQADSTKILNWQRKSRTILRDAAHFNVDESATTINGTLNNNALQTTTKNE